jgi:phenylalanine-4-hydroxylase
MTRIWFCLAILTLVVNLSIAWKRTLSVTSFGSQIKYYNKFRSFQRFSASEYAGTDPLIWSSPRIAILTEIKDEPGALYDILRYFWKYEINLTHIESRPCPKNSDGFHIFIDFTGNIGEPRIDKLMQELSSRCRNMLVLDERRVPWFPRHISELDRIAPRTLDAGADLESDHPGFHDITYRTRRQELASIALNHRFNQEIPYIQYTPDEVATWAAVYTRLTTLHKQYACTEFLDIWPLMEAYCGYREQNIPQARDVSNFLQARTGFQIRPVAGLLTSRDFLNGLAFRVFFSTQYIRHHSKPLYTPEPDICHELIGHAPLFADPNFADFSQEIGLASLGASDEDIKRLATCYWHSVEFGLLRDKKDRSKVKAYGAGVLSSFGELQYACTGK